MSGDLDKAAVDDWIELPDPDEREDQPVGSDDDLAGGTSGYDAADDPASRPPTGTPPTGGGLTRGAGYPIAPAAIPGWLKQHANGALPTEVLVPVADLAGMGGALVPEAAGAWRNLQNAASAAGFQLTMTNAYRSLAQQEAMFLDRFQREQTAGKSKVWNGTTYWLKPKMAMAAVPGNSNHGWGCAVDMALDGYGRNAKPVAGNGAFMAWAVKNAGAYGWSWEVQSEPWHIRLVSFDVAKAASPATTPPQAPQPTLAEGSEGGQVAALQSICALFQWGDVRRPDGKFGPRTKAAVQAMQTALSRSPDGEYGPKTAASLGEFLASVKPAG
jgi:D-alanyl-D-alanine carboxypeptidase/Putative peptidoglycan binding domain